MLILNWAKTNSINIINNEKEKSSETSYHTVSSKMIFVGNLDESIDETELIRFFKNQKFHSIISSRVIKDSFNGKSKGFGFLNLSNYKEYQYLLNLNKLIILKGKILMIK